MLKYIKSKLNFKLTKLKKANSKFRITKIDSTNDKNNPLSFGNTFDIITKINPGREITFTIIDEIDDKLIMFYDEQKTVNLYCLATSYTTWNKKHHSFNKNEFLKQLSYFKPSQSN